MSTGTNQAPKTFNEYLERLSGESPEVALKMAMAETERAQAASRAATAVVLEFDDQGRIAKANYAGLRRLADEYSRSDLVPEHYKGKPANCFIALQMSMRMKIDPFAYMQNSCVVHGKPGIEAKLAIAMLNQSGKIRGRVGYDIERDAKGEITSCMAKVIDAGTGEVIDGEPITAKLVKSEKWDAKNGSKWLTMPGQMYRYRSAVFLIRASYPEVMMGIQTVDELEDICPAAPATVDDITSELQQQTEELEVAGNEPDEPQDSAPGYSEALREMTEAFEAADSIEAIAQLQGQEFVDYEGELATDRDKLADHHRKRFQKKGQKELVE